jgi:RNA polymerase sigma factor (sigma-70 family)
VVRSDTAATPRSTESGRDRCVDLPRLDAGLLIDPTRPRRLRQLPDRAVQETASAVSLVESMESDLPRMTSDDFTEFFAEAEPRLRRAFVAAYGPERGREAAAEALTHAWEHWERVKEMDNAIGFLYRVGQSRSRPRRRPRPFPPAAETPDQWVEPQLPDALNRLSERERTAVVLIEGFGWTFREVADTIGVSVSSVQSYFERGLHKLRTALGVDDA